MQILSFDSVYMLLPIRKLYLKLISILSQRLKSSKNRLILYRLDKDNFFLTDKRNISSESIGVSNELIESMSVKFYRYIGKTGNYKTLSLNNISLYQVYPRQVRLKLEGVLRGALRIKKISNESEENIEVITDRHSASIMKKAFQFLNYSPTNLTWKLNSLLTFCISINSLILRLAAITKMNILSSSFPNEYFYKHINSSAPTVLITMPKNRPEDFFSIYVEKFSNEFNIVLYSLGYLKITPEKYERIQFKKTTRVLKSIFNFKNVFFSSDSYITDVLLIFKNHEYLNMCQDLVSSIFSKKIDAHISRCQTNVIDTYLAIEAQKRGIFILGDIEEEIYFCDSAVCSAKSNNTESVRLAVAKNGKIVYKGSNSMIDYRFENFSNKDDHYLHKLLRIDSHKKIIFYASNPLKEESQRYLTEKLLIDYFSSFTEFILVIKIHPQDNGNITNQAYLNSSRPLNVILIGDIKQKSKIISKKFNIFEAFEFNAALTSCDGFLTVSSSAIFQALKLGVKSGLIDMFNNAQYDFLINYNAATLINNEETLRSFLVNKKLDISDDILNYCGLKNNNKEFDLGTHLLKCLEGFNKKKL
jgi:hypothetical protein